MKKNATTLIEVLVVLIVIAILIGVAIPTYNNRIERVRGETAIANIEMIKDVCKQYYARYNRYAAEIRGLDNINSNLSLDIRDDNFIYSIVNISSTFNNTIQANRASGPHIGRKIRYSLNARTGNPDEWDAPGSDWPWMP